MRLMTFGIAGLMAVAAMTPVAAAAQPGYGHGHRDRWDDRRGRDDRRGWDERRGWRDDRGGWRGDRGWNDRRGWHDDRRRYARNWNNGPRVRTVCRWVDGYYGPVRRCFDVRR